MSLPRPTSSIRTVRRALDQAWRRPQMGSSQRTRFLRRPVNPTTCAKPQPSVRRQMITTRELTTDQMRVVSWLTTPRNQRAQYHRGAC